MPPPKDKTMNPVPIESHRALVNGVRLHYLKAGQGEPVVLLHGWPQTSHAWRKVMPQLAGRFTVIAPDLRGLGDSDKPAAGYDKRTVAQDIFELARALCFETFHLVGHDLGMQVAYALAASHPKAVRSLTLIEALLAGLGLEGAMNFTQPHAFIHMALNMQRDFAEALVAGKERLYIEHHLRPFAYDPEAIAQEDVDRYVRSYSAPGGMRAGFEHYRSYFQDAADNKVFAQTQLPMPVLAIGGEASLGEYVAGTLKPLAQSLQSRIAARAGHYVPEEQPQWLADELSSFIERSGGARP
jgi:pimeloyl-ACP methyl ester carboxylesterase